MSYTKAPVSNHRFLFGEAPLWHHHLKKLVFVDCFHKSIGIWDPSNRTLVQRKVPSSDTHKEFDYIILAMPYDSPKEDKFLVATSAGQLLQVEIDYLNELPDASTSTQVYSLEGQRAKFSDGKCDRKGRLWIGSCAEDPTQTMVPMLNAGKLHLYEVTKNTMGQLKLRETICGQNFDVPNGLTFNKSNDKLYWADLLPKRVVYVFDFDIESGSISNQKKFFDFNDHPELVGYPDGITADVEENLWIACWKGGCIIKIEGKTGKLLDKVELPVTNTTSLCFGGPEYNRLFVTTASIELDQSEVIGEPDSGTIFEITNPKDNSFRGFQNYFLPPLI